MSAWSEIVNHDGSDEWLELCNAALAEIKRVQSSRLRGGLEGRIYEALVTFQNVACWSILQHAQMRQYLAEHLAQALIPADIDDVDREQMIRAAAFREAARVIEQLGHDDDAVAVLDNIASGITEPVHANRMRCLDPACGPCSFDRAIPKETQR